jgi:hypothetical protein
MDGVTEDRVSGPVKVPIHWRGIEAAEEPEEAVRTTAVQGLQDHTRAKNQQRPSDLCQRITSCMVLVVSGVVKVLSQNLWLTDVHLGEGGEPHLSGEIVGAQGIGKKARTGLIEKDGCGECPAIIGTGVEGVVNGWAFQIVLHGSLRNIQALMDSDFGKRNLLYENSSTV